MICCCSSGNPGDEDAEDEAEEVAGDEDEEEPRRKMLKKKLRLGTAPDSSVIEPCRECEDERAGGGAGVTTGALVMVGAATGRLTTTLLPRTR